MLSTIPDKILKEDRDIVFDTYYKVIEVDLESGNYFEVTSHSNQATVFYDVTKWAASFGKYCVHPDDADRFIKFFDKFKSQALAHEEIDRQKLFYRRVINDEWIWVCMEIIIPPQGDREYPYALITVKEVQEYLDGFRKATSKLD